MTDDSRPRGVLTPTDRRYLTGESHVEPATNQSRSTRHRIRERTRHAIRDFELLFRHLEARDRESIFHKHPDSDEGEANPLHGGIRGFISMLYLENEREFTEVIEQAIEDAAAKDGWESEASVDLAVTQKRTVRDLYEDIQESGEWHADEIGVLSTHIATADDPEVSQAELDALLDHTPASDHPNEPRGGFVPDNVTDAEQAIAELRVGHGEQSDTVREGVKAAYSYLRNHDGPLPRDEMADRLAPVYPLPNSDVHGWGRSIGRLLAELPGVEETTETIDGEQTVCFRATDSD